MMSNAMIHVSLLRVQWWWAWSWGGRCCLMLIIRLCGSRIGRICCSVSQMATFIAGNCRVANRMAASDGGVMRRNGEQRRKLFERGSIVGRLVLLDF